MDTREVERQPVPTTEHQEPDERSPSGKKSGGWFSLVTILVLSNVVFFGLWIRAVMTKPSPTEPTALTAETSTKLARAGHDKGDAKAVEAAKAESCNMLKELKEALENHSDDIEDKRKDLVMNMEKNKCPASTGAGHVDAKHGGRAMAGGPGGGGFHDSCSSHPHGSCEKYQGCQWMGNPNSGWCITVNVPDEDMCTSHPSQRECQNFCWPVGGKCTKCEWHYQSNRCMSVDCQELVTYGGSSTYVPKVSSEVTGFGNCNLGFGTPVKVQTAVAMGGRFMDGGRPVPVECVYPLQGTRDQYLVGTRTGADNHHGGTTYTTKMVSVQVTTTTSGRVYVRAVEARNHPQWSFGCDNAQSLNDGWKDGTKTDVATSSQEPGYGVIGLKLKVAMRRR